jgi:phosphoglycolate phosphatase
MAPFAAVIFDLDGTLVDSAVDITLILNGVLASIGRPPLAVAAVTEMIGDGPRALLERALAAGGGLDGVDIPTLVRRFVADYDATPVAHTRPYDGAVAALTTLRAQGAKLALCTNKPEGATRAVVAALGLDPFFDAIVGSGTLAGVHKPDRRMLETTLERLGCASDAAVMVGDAAPDVGVARNAGVPVVLRAGGYSRVPAETLGADAVFHHFAELPPLLAALAARRRG